MGKAVVISSLAVRFYKIDGWDRGILEGYGDSLITKDSGECCEYYVFDSKFDYEKLYNEHIIELCWKDRWGELKNLSDLEILKKRCQ